MRKLSVMTIAMCLMFVWSAQIALAAEAKAVKEQKNIDPRETCMVTGDKLGSMGKPVDYDYKGRPIQFCCSGCKPKFEADPAKYLKQREAAIIAYDKPNYPLDKCVVLGEPLTDKSVDYVFSGKVKTDKGEVFVERLVRFCCSGCIEKFNQDPAKYLKMIDDAAKAKSTPGTTKEKKP